MEFTDIMRDIAGNITSVAVLCSLHIDSTQRFLTRTQRIRVKNIQLVNEIVCDNNRNYESRL